MEAICAVTVKQPIGTNLALLHFLWMQLSGTLLSSRGALFPALQAIGLSPREVRRAWAAFRSGDWQIAELLSAWEAYVQAQGQWQVSQYEGYCPKAVDLTAYWRPNLKGCRSKHYYPPAQKALPAIVLGIIARVGRVNGQRVAVMTHLVRADPDDPTEANLQTAVVRQVAETLTDDEMLVSKSVNYKRYNCPGMWSGWPRILPLVAMFCLPSKGMAADLNMANWFVPWLAPTRATSSRLHPRIGWKRGLKSEWNFELSFGTIWY